MIIFIQNCHKFKKFSLFQLNKIFTLTQKVYEGIPIMKGWQSIPLAGKAIQRYF